MHRPPVIFHSVLCAILAALALPARAWPGDPDFGFGSMAAGKAPGTVVHPFPDADWPPAGLFVQSDGKIVAAGNSNTAFHLARFRADGTLDPDFGTGGSVATTFNDGPSAFANFYRAARQTDGKFLLTGYAGPGANMASSLVVVRYLPDGTLDNAFGDGGKVLTGIEGQWNGGIDVAPLSDGKILVLGFVQSLAPTFILNLLYRFLPDGRPDVSFGPEGFVQVDGPPLQRMAVQTDGKIVLGTDVIDGLGHLRLARVDAAGAPDASFGHGGVLTDTLPPGRQMQFKEMALQSDGKILVAGNAITRAPIHSDFMLSRFNPDGSPDVSFNGNGRVMTNLSSGPSGESEDVLNALVVQSDGKLLAGGVAGNEFKIVRYLPDGSLDSRFGNGGIATAGVSGYLYSMAVQPDGKILTGGFSQSPGINHMALARNIVSEQLQGLAAEWPAGDPLTYWRTVDLGAVAKSTPRVLETTLTLRNMSDAPVTGMTAALSGPDAQRFTLVSPVPPVIDGHGSVPLTVQFTPASEVATFSAVLTIAPGDPELEGVTVALHAATVGPVATLAFFDGSAKLTAGATVDFGPGLEGVSITRGFTIKNTGTIDLLLQGISFGAEGTPGDFIAGVPDADVLAPGASTALPVTFTASGPGSRTATLRIASTDTFNPPLEIHLKGTMAQGLDLWRLTYFGTLLNEGPAYDLSDPDGDGIPNLLEYAILTNPVEPSAPAGQLVKNGDMLEYTIFGPSNAAAFVDYALEWSNSLPGSWVEDGVFSQLISDDGTRQGVTFFVSAAGKNGRKFMRLRVTRK